MNINTKEFVEKVLHTVDAAFGDVTRTMYKKAGEFTEYVYNTTAKFAEKVRNTTAEFAEKVRRVFREEFSNFLASLLGVSSIGDPACGKIIVMAP